jgi:hypothetical protein
MKFFTILSLLLIQSSLLCSRLAAANEGIVVMEFTGLSSRMLTRQLSDVCRSSVELSLEERHFELIPKTSMPSSYWSYLTSGEEGLCLEPRCLLEFGREMEATIMISGTLMEMNGLLRVTVTMHDVDSGRLISSRIVKSDNPIELLELTSQNTNGMISEWYKQSFNASPICHIVSPTEQHRFPSGNSIFFDGTITDSDSSHEQLNATWSSDRLGDISFETPSEIGKVYLDKDFFTPQRHKIVLSAVDELGASCSDSISVTITSPPSAQIRSPDIGVYYEVGEEIQFSGEVKDVEDSSGKLTLNWRSNIDGTLSTRSPSSDGMVSFSRADLSVGLHRIVLVVTDTDGQTEESAVHINIYDPDTLTLYEKWFVYPK